MTMTEHEQAWREEYAKTLKILMHKKNIGTRQLAQMLGISKSAVDRYVTGERIPNVYIAQRIKEVLTL